jgi:hypothetical protein
MGSQFTQRRYVRRCRARFSARACIYWLQTAASQLIAPSTCGHTAHAFRSSYVLLQLWPSSRRNLRVGRMHADGCPNSVHFARMDGWWSNVFARASLSVHFPPWLLVHGLAQPMFVSLGLGLACRHPLNCMLVSAACLRVREAKITCSSRASVTKWYRFLKRNLFSKGLNKFEGNTCTYIYIYIYMSRTYDWDCSKTSVPVILVLFHIYAKLKWTGTRHFLHYYHPHHDRNKSRPSSFVEMKERTVLFTHACLWIAAMFATILNRGHILPRTCHISHKLLPYFSIKRGLPHWI